MTEDFSFKRPIEAPTFHPTEEEFSDPLGYISKIRPVAERFGICKIKPPANWAPPFAVDVDKFKFVPRIQKINELEAITRIKLNFLDQISKFWELQGTSLRIPLFGHKALDLYTLHQLVHTNDFKNSKLSDDRKWNMIATRMGLQSSTKLSVGNQLKAHYDKILYPYDIWKSNQKTKSKKNDTPTSSPKKARTVKSRMGGRMGGPNKPKIHDPLANYICQNCKGGDVEEKMLLCDGCDDSYHTFCLKPPLDDVPKGEWRCPDCLEEKLSRPNDGFGFEQATREYTLQQFGEMADTFKSDYFNMPVHMVSSEMVEKEFWRIVSAIDEDVIVEYGADLHTMDHGSGFPTVPSTGHSDADEMYVTSGWNLNRLPVLKGSVFGHINADISGMKIPWMYVGMCFSTFCWHNEDHWSYSINYLHWGEPKTWYGVPGNKADDFENAMKSAAPELFAAAPDLLHQLVTIMNPNILEKANVPVYRMDQKAGEFIITFPRAYHAGFNQGYNFAEAVNFAPADWVQMGRECVMHYSKLNRFCVFSHDELVCAMATQPKKLDQLIAIATYKDMMKMIEAEQEYRKEIHKWGVTQSEKVQFEVLADDCRQCNTCKTTLFLSALACSHGKGTIGKDTKLVCLKHYDQIGCRECKKDGKKHILKYRYTLTELPEMMKSVQMHTEDYEKWLKSISDGLDSKGRKLTLEELGNLLDEAGRNSYPRTELLIGAEKIRAEAEKTSKIAKALIGTPAVRTRKGCASDVKFKCTIAELKLLAEDMKFLRVDLPEKQYVANLYASAEELRNKAKDYLLSSSVTLDEISNCLEECLVLDVEFEEISQLRNKLSREKWLRLANSDDDKSSIWTLDYLRKVIEEGNEVIRNEVADKKMAELCELFEHATDWEIAAITILSAKEKHKISQLEDLVKMSEEIAVALPSLPQLREVINKAQNWLDKVKSLCKPISKTEKNEQSPFLEDLISMVELGELLPIEFEQMRALKSQISAANIWRENCMKVFLKRNSTIELIEALLPRKQIPKHPQRGKRKRLAISAPTSSIIANILSAPITHAKDESYLVNICATKVDVEREQMKALRKENLLKLKIKSEGNEGPVFCLCGQPKMSFMIRCELCYEWFHPTCVPLPKLPYNENSVDAIKKYSSQAVIAHKISTRETKFIGPCCARSRRPEYKTILSLLLNLEQIPLHLPEGIAIQCLTDRAMKWQEKCDKLVQNPAISGIVDIIKRNAMKVITSPNKSLDTGSNTTSDNPTPSHKIFFDQKAIIEHSAKLLSGTNSKSGSDSKSDIPGRTTEMEIALCLATMQQGTVNASVTPVKVEESVRTSNTTSDEKTSVLRPTEASAETPPIKLDPHLVQEIENLLIEADLMELTVDEGDTLWKLYDLAHPTIQESWDLKEIQRFIDDEIHKKGLSDWESHQDSLKQGTRKRKRSDDSNVQVKKSPSKKRKPSGDTSTKRKKTNQECDEDCAADSCRQPTGKEVNWIQCDGCDQWFHLTCVGLKKSQIKNLEKYTCRCCEKRRDIQDRDADDGSSCDTDSKLSTSGNLSISSNKENAHQGDVEDLVREAEAGLPENPVSCVMVQ